MARWRRSLLLWYGEHGRHLPWRATTDPYRIWLSEIILQQTRIVQGLPYYERFMQSFPTIEALAKADIDQVMNLWQGLGYYSRARNLHKAAQQIVARGAMPATYEEWLQVSGVGPYTAAAVASFALGERRAVVDGNVYRVLARHYGIDTPIDTTEGKRLFSELAQRLIDAERPGDYNQAIMDFGALQCLPQGPLCESCPMTEQCVACRMESAAEWPVRSRTTRVQTLFLVMLYVRMPAGIWLHKRTDADIWQGLYEPLTLRFDHQPAMAEVVAAARLPKDAVFRPVMAQQKHLLSHRQLWVDGYEVRLSENRSRKGFVCVPETSRGDYAVSTLVARFYEKLDRTE